MGDASTWKDDGVLGVLVGFGVIAAVIAVGWLVGRTGVLGPGARYVLARLAFFVLTPSLLLTVLADADIAPTDADNGDPSLVAGESTHISEPERAAFRAFGDAGLTDVVRPLVPTGFTYWDYKQLRFPRNEGLRIDFVLGSPALADLVTGAEIHRDERKGDAPSDHVPVVVDLALDAEDDDRPMIF